ncbi:MAG: PqqD family protein [Ruminococcus sp.]|nr:PqqD family protein [Ruminococcus sp.]
MKIKDGFVLRTISDSHIVVPLGSKVTDFCSIIKLSDTGAFLWERLSEDVSFDYLVESLTAEYDVDTEKAKCDINKFISNLKKADLLE